MFTWQLGDPKCQRKYILLWAINRLVFHVLFYLLTGYFIHLFRLLITEWPGGVYNESDASALFRHRTLTKNIKNIKKYL